MTTAGPPLSEAKYDRAALHRSDEAWLAAAWDRARVVLISRRSATPVTDDARVIYRAAADAPAGPRRFLGLVEEVPYFAVTADADGDGWQTLREFGARADELDASLVVSAIALEQWHQRHQHCPRCGATTVESQAGWTRTCTNDGSEHFPRTDPAVIMLVHDGGDQALLGRGQQWGEGRFSTLAGFVEPGESLEAAVAREVFEEVGRRGARHPLPRFAAVAVPGLADARLRGPARRRLGDHPRSGRDGRGRHGSLATRCGRRPTGPTSSSIPSRPGRCGRSRRTSRSRATSSIAGWRVRCDLIYPPAKRIAGWRGSSHLITTSATEIGCTDSS